MNLKKTIEITEKDKILKTTLILPFVPLPLSACSSEERLWSAGNSEAGSIPSAVFTQPSLPPSHVTWPMCCNLSKPLQFLVVSIVFLLPRILPKTLVVCHRCMGFFSKEGPYKWSHLISVVWATFYRHFLHGYWPICPPIGNIWEYSFSNPSISDSRECISLRR